MGGWHQRKKEREAKRKATNKSREAQLLFFFLGGSCAATSVPSPGGTLYTVEEPNVPAGMAMQATHAGREEGRRTKRTNEGRGKVQGGQAQGEAAGRAEGGGTEEGRGEAGSCTATTIKQSHVAASRHNEQRPRRRGWMNNRKTRASH